MKVIKFFSILGIMFLILFANFSAEAAKKVVAVVALENVSDYDKENISEIMTEQLIDAIYNSGQYTVIETTQMGAVLKQQGFENLVSSQAVEFGNKTGSDYTVVGKIILAKTSENLSGIIGLFTGGIKGDGLGLLGQLANFEGVKARIELQVRFVDNKSGEIVFSKNFSGEKTGKDSKTALISAGKVAAENFLKELQTASPFAARVADIDGDKIYIDQGSTSGLHEGEVLMISRELEPIVVNEKIVGVKTISVCKVTVIEVSSDYAVCRASDRSNSIQKGDIVKRN